MSCSSWTIPTRRVSSGATGRGTAEEQGVFDRIPVTTGTLGKAMGSAAGGFVTGPRALVETLRQRSRTYLFSNSLPPAVAAGSLEAFRMLREDPSPVARLRENAAYFRRAMTDAGFTIPHGSHPIVPVIVGETAKAFAMGKALFEKGIYVSGFGFPVVPTRPGPLALPGLGGPRPGRPRPGRRGLPRGRKAVRDPLLDSNPCRPEVRVGPFSRHNRPHSMNTTRKAGARRASLGLCLGLAISLTAGPSAALEPRKALTQYTHQTWQAHEGLPQNSILAMVQGRQGYLWLGTQEGLVRFDGVRFTVFERAQTGLSHNFVRALREDRSGALWIGTNGGGVNRLQNGVFQAFRRREGLPSDEVNCIYEDQAGTVWVGTTAGLVRLEGSRFTTDSVPPDLRKRDIRALGEDGDGNLWSGADDGSLHRVTGGAAGIDRIPVLGSGVINVLFRDRAGALWIGTDGDGLARWKDGALTHYTKRQGLSSPKVLSILEDRAGCLWIGTDGGGINRFCRGRFTSYSARDGLSNAFVSSLCEDREGNLWIGTHGGGLNRFSDGNFTRFGSAEGLTFEDHATYLESRDGSFWIGTWGGGLYRTRDGVVKSYTERDGLSYDEVSSLAEDAEGRVWIGTWGGGLNVFEKGTLPGRRVPSGFAPGQGHVPPRGRRRNALGRNVRRGNRAAPERSLDRVQRGSGLAQ